MSCFVAFCRDVASFFCAHKCDMSDPKQDINGVSTSIPVGFDHRWTQVDADIKTGIGYRISDIGSRIPVWGMAIPKITQKEVLRVALSPGRSRASSIRAPQPDGVTKSRCQRSARESARKTSARRTESGLHQSTILVKQIHSETGYRKRAAKGAALREGNKVY